MTPVTGRCALCQEDLRQDRVVDETLRLDEIGHEGACIVVRSEEPGSRSGGGTRFRLGIKFAGTHPLGYALHLVAARQVIQSLIEEISNGVIELLNAVKLKRGEFLRDRQIT